MAELADTINNFAAYLMRQVTRPEDWARPLVILLQRLESLAPARDQDHPTAYELMLERLRDAIDDRLQKHMWRLF